MDDFMPAVGIDWHGTTGTVQYGNDQKLVLFYKRPVHNPQKSRELGRPYHENKIFVQISEPGDRLTRVDRAVTEEDKRRWPQQWAQFSQNAEQVTPGTPIEMLYSDNPAMCANLRGAGIQTIEQCAELSGHAIDSIGMGAQHAVNDAKKYLEMSTKGVHFARVKHELEERDSQIRILSQQVEQLKAEVAKVTSPNNMASPQMQTQLAALLSGMMQNPQMPPPGVAPAQVFDVQSAQIAATHPSVDEAAPRKRGRPRKNPV